MPSGAKKRKAKKKKENQSNIHHNPSTQSHGGDVKHRDDKESDVGGVSSSASHDHLNLLSPVVEEENVVQIEKEFKIEDKLSDKSSSGSSSSSSRSNSTNSSDDESHDIKNSQAVVDISPVVDKMKPTDLLSETAAEPIHTATIEEACVSAVETPVVDEIMPLVEKAEVNVSSSGDNSVSQEIYSLVDDASKRKHKEEEIVIQSVENIAAVSDPKKCVVAKNENNFDNGAEHEKDSGETQQLLQPLLGDPVQKASWKSCCGLCELFTSR